MLTVAVVIPALDEEHGIARVLAGLPREGELPPPPAATWNAHGAPPVAAPRFRVREVVVADNGSRDRTADVARARGATVVHEPRRGYGAACLAALAHLRTHPPDVVAFLDADGSDDPGELAHLLSPLAGGRADLVIGSRVLGEHEAGSLSPVQAFGNALATFLLRVLFGGRFSDLGPFRAIRWAALERIGMRDRDYGWTVEMQARALKAGLACLEIPVRYRRRAAGRSKVSGTLRGVAGAGWKILYTIARVRFGG